MGGDDVADDLVVLDGYDEPKKLENEHGMRVEILDGDEVRKGLSRDLGLSREDREEHAWRVSFVSKLLSRNGMISIVALIPPYRNSRENAKKMIGPERFFEVYVKASLAVCEMRDPKGLYAKARKGEITNMTGIQDPYEEPTDADIVAETEKGSPDSSAALIIKELQRRCKV